MSQESIEWIAVDWGTSNLRCRAMSSRGDVLFRAESEKGMNSIVESGGDFETALRELIQPWLREGETIRVEACGMVGAKQGWIEAPYCETPCSPATSRVQAPSRDGGMEVWIRSGVKQTSPPDVMRGEETQIAGLVSLHPDFEGLVCLPGTHTKWAQVRNKEIQSFQTFFTGEVFSLLASQSVLRLSLSPEGWEKAAFLEGVTTSFESPESLLSDCFRLRAKALLEDLDGVRARSQLSGLLIGHELSGVLKNSNQSPRIFLIGSDDLVEVYREGLESLSISTEAIASESAVIRGLSTVFNQEP